jgi:outer membrane protein OmpA-like peptidoglycan-associated protein
LDSGGDNAPAKRMGIGVAVGAAGGAALHIILCNRAAEPAALTVDAELSPGAGAAPLRVDFRASASDPGGQGLTWAWDFGDGTRASTQSGSHTYEGPGHYSARVRVTDNRGRAAQALVQVHVSEGAPQVTRRIVLRGVHFDFDRSNVKPAAEAVLFQAAAILEENPSLRVQVTGYTDSTGPAAYNQGLSERRASAVKAWLISHGIAASRLDAIGYGASMPVADSATERGQAQNRRVELNVLQ